MFGETVVNKRKLSSLELKTLQPIKLLKHDN